MPIIFPLPITADYFLSFIIFLFTLATKWAKVAATPIMYTSHRLFMYATHWITSLCGLEPLLNITWFVSVLFLSVYGTQGLYPPQRIKKLQKSLWTVASAHTPIAATIFDIKICITVKLQVSQYMCCELSVLQSSKTRPCKVFEDFIIWGPTFLKFGDYA